MARHRLEKGTDCRWLREVYMPPTPANTNFLRGAFLFCAPSKLIFSFEVNIWVFGLDTPTLKGREMKKHEIAS